MFCSEDSANSLIGNKLFSSVQFKEERQKIPRFKLKPSKYVNKKSRQKHTECSSSEPACS